MNRITTVLATLTVLAVTTAAAGADVDDAQRHAAEGAVDGLGEVEPLELAPLVGHGTLFTSVSQ